MQYACRMFMLLNFVNKKSFNYLCYAIALKNGVFGCVLHEMHWKAGEEPLFKIFYHTASVDELLHSTS